MHCIISFMAFLRRQYSDATQVSGRQELGEGVATKGQREGLLWGDELFCILTVVVVTQISPSVKIHRPAHHKVNVTIR